MVRAVIILLVLSVVGFATADDQPTIPIVSQESSVDVDGKYHYSYESGDGTKAEQDGELKVIDKESGEVSHGSWSYVADDGKTYSVSYVADENGYQPQAEHLPVPPEIPPLIQKALAYLATAPPPQDDLEA